MADGGWRRVALSFRINLCAMRQNGEQVARRYKKK